ncbi:hypothetical protein [Polaromonas sp. LjRoot131]|uniref:hypothetical protein n=1 Tax=Polaromonas sp. LjRoot131 TaxID=3342262 RepID=UPI003ECDCFEF
MKSICKWTAWSALFFLSANASGQAREFFCSKSMSEMAPEYPQLVCRGNEYLERGKPKAALELYEKAAALDFFESPNFLIYWRIANAQCQAGQKDRAQKTAREFDSMLNIYIGISNCPSEIRAEDSLSIRTMCPVAFSPETYANEAGMAVRKRTVLAYRERLAKLEVKCR